MKRTNGKFWGKILAIIALVGMVAMYASCDNSADGPSLNEHEQKLVGKWMETASNSGFEFRSDKTMDVILAGSVSATGNFSATATEFTAGNQSFPYTISGNTLTVSVGGGQSATYTKQ